ncbi:MAG TPA: glycosyltransferase [Flavobacterium sp.]|uniref:glycosyltransferase n=1 Tax=Flavobacterium sp. TaxID=239 RepID=UPI002B4AD3D0|nr:glycosyltransferase [Flavobacterium sp.]HLO73757.1 glycosyltransferase [Flavobacterium sp.]
MEQIKKKILLLSSGDVNGAYEAVYRLGKHFISKGHQVKMLVKNRTKPDSFIITYLDAPKPYKRKSILERLLQKIKNKFSIKIITPKINYDLNYDFISVDETSVNVSSNRILELIGFTPEIVYTGMTDNFMNSTDLLNLQQLTNAEVYNIAVDMNHFTGGCHFAWDCNGYIEGCSSKCPAILGVEGKEIPKINFETKLSNAKKGNFKIIGMSQWTVNQAKDSYIYRGQKEYLNVNSLIDTSLFNSNNKAIAKRIFDMNDDTFYILMGCQHANAKRKGFEYLLAALQSLEKKLTVEQKSKIEVLIVSRSKVDSFNEIPFHKKHIDYINDYRLLALLYQASDVFVNSSIEDAGPMMVSEALACGTPVVGFDMGVVNNMVISGYNGYKAKLKDSKDLANGIKTIFELSPESYKEYSKNAVKQVEQYSSLNAVDKILNLNT